MESVFKPCCRAIFKRTNLTRLGGMGAEHPCFGCGVDDCNVRVVEYHDRTRKYISPPKNPKPLRELIF